MSACSEAAFGAKNEASRKEGPALSISPRFGMLTDRFGVAWMVGVMS
jgi:uncharacterized glyoxalase superfamily protein PhnB